MKMTPEKQEELRSLVKDLRHDGFTDSLSSKHSREAANEIEFLLGIVEELETQVADAEEALAEYEEEAKQMGMDRDF